MIFNKTGRLIEGTFTVNGHHLEPVRNFCYLGYDISAGGNLNHTINNLADKATKAMRPIFTTISRFNLPVKLAIKLFNTYLSPIMLYNVENWAILPPKLLDNCSMDTLMNVTIGSKPSIIQRKFLKYVLGVSRSCPNLPVMGDVNESPLLLKGFRLMIKYWKRVTTLTDDLLVKKALLEKISLRSDWIRTIERLMNMFNLTNYIESPPKLDEMTKINIDINYKNWWKRSKNSYSSLDFYNTVKEEPRFEEYLDMNDFQTKKAISKIRFSDHELAIERDRHKAKAPSRLDRICKMCNNNAIESEMHFLAECPFYDDVKTRIGTTFSLLTLFNEPNDSLGKYIISALHKRKMFLDSLLPQVGGRAP